MCFICFFFFKDHFIKKWKLLVKLVKHWWVRRPTWSTRKAARGDGKICYYPQKRPYTLLNISLLRHVSFPLFYFVVIRSKKKKKKNLESVFFCSVFPSINLLTKVVGYRFRYAKKFSMRQAHKGLFGRPFQKQF